MVLQEINKNKKKKSVGKTELNDDCTQIKDRNVKGSVSKNQTVN